MKVRERVPLAPGARVVIRDEEWLVLGANTATYGGDAVRVRGLSELVRDREAVFLTDLDPLTVLTPQSTRLVVDNSPRFRRSRLYIEALLRRTPPTDASLCMGHRAALNPARYQQVPTAKALAQMRPRILIADAVGLGKTIEVGILLAELIRRGRGERILVITLKSILTQFQEELWSRFAIPLVRLDSVGLQRVQSSLPANQNPFYYFSKVIISIDTLKKDEKYRRYLENCRWDVIVVDECQHVAERARSLGSLSQRARLARLLANTSDALILTSATPHDGRPESFASLLKLLEPTAVGDSSDYSREEVEHLFVRRFKKDILAEMSVHFPDRSVQLERIPTTPPEEQALATLSVLQLSRETAGERLFRTTLLKAYLSSPAACLETLRQRLKKPMTSADRSQLEGLQGAVASVTLQDFGKWRRLVELLREFGYSRQKTGDRLVLFSERLETLRVLEKALLEEFSLPDPTVGLFFGSLDDQRQQEIVHDFSQAAGRIRILLASDAASEGINMHEHCHRMIHFDIPWSLITLEQRNGRIDRYGQTQKPDIRYLLTIPRSPALQGDLRVLERLIDKENQAHKNLGDVAWLMNLHEAKKEEERVARAIEAHESPEDVIPDEPPQDEEDFMALLLAGGAAEAEPPMERDPLTLYSSDEAFARVAFLQLNEDLKSRGNEPLEVEWLEHLEGSFLLSSPPELQRRYRYLPKEIAPEGGRLRLTTDRALLLREREKARRDGRWTDWSLLWDAHPAAVWLLDRVLSLFMRHEAPVLQVPGVVAGARGFLFQGVYSNRRSQPVLVEWPTAILDAFGRRVETLSLPELVHRVGLDQDLNNPGNSVPIEPLMKLRPQAVQMAREEMERQRGQRSAALQERLKSELRKLRDWKTRREKELVLREARLRAQQGTVRSDQQRRLVQERADVERTYNERHQYVENSLRTEPEPYLRLVAVFVSQESP